MLDFFETGNIIQDTAQNDIVVIIGEILATMNHYQCQQGDKTKFQKKKVLCSKKVIFYWLTKSFRYNFNNFFVHFNIDCQSTCSDKTLK